ncbi:hypothetical protein R83H12_00969 [Fibrobacteria bacterium R8-3-H12]
MKKLFSANHSPLATSLILFILLLGCGGEQGALPNVFEQNSLDSSSSSYSSYSSINSSSSSNGSSSSSVKSSSSSSSSVFGSSSGGCKLGTIKHGDIDYITVEIGTQTWFQENLKYGDGVCNGNDPSCEYGKLYKWAMADTVCPAGWKLPTLEDWETLMYFVDGKQSSPGTYEDGDIASETAGLHLKAASGWKSGNGDDKHCFMALPGGDGNSNGTFGDVGYLGNWWSATGDENYAYNLSISGNENAIYWYENLKTRLFSVRCLKK